MINPPIDVEEKYGVLQNNFFMAKSSIELLQENRKLRVKNNESEKCYICDTRAAEVLYGSCSHAGLCLPCTLVSYMRNQSCQICRTDITGFFMLYKMEEGTGRLLSTEKVYLNNSSGNRCQQE